MAERPFIDRTLRARIQRDGWMWSAYLTDGTYDYGYILAWTERGVQRKVERWARRLERDRKRRNESYEYRP